jgi:glycosyltransferase involved in cell wall biosynthesis
LGIILTLLQKKPHNIYLTHINFAPLILLIQLFLPRSKVWIVLHGFEAWIKINKLSRLSVNLCAGILSVSSYTKNEFCKNNMISPTKVQVIYLTYGKYTWSPNLENNSIEDLDLSFVLCVSRLEPAHAYYKGVDKTILAIVALARSGRLGGYHLVIVGEGDDRQRLMELAEQEGIAHLVHFTGRISDIELKAYYAYCEMFVLPSTKEGFGLVYLEAMSFGKPVIASQEGASKEIVIDGLTGYLVPDGDIGALAGKISLLIDSKDERERLGKAGQERYLENFTFSKFVERLKTTLLE